MPLPLCCRASMQAEACCRQGASWASAQACPCTGPCTKDAPWFTQAPPWLAPSGSLPCRTIPPAPPPFPAASSWPPPTWQPSLPPWPSPGGPSTPSSSPCSSPASPAWQVGRARSRCSPPLPGKPLCLCRHGTPAWQPRSFHSRGAPCGHAPSAAPPAGNLLFVAAFQWRSLGALLLARMLNGLGSARTANRRYTADYVSRAKRTMASAGWAPAPAVPPDGACSGGATAAAGALRCSSTLCSLCPACPRAVAG